eukprot:403376983
MFEIPPGPRFIPVSLTVNAQKLGMPLWLAFLVYYYQNYSDQMLMYSVMHGTYGVLWYLKHITFPDKFADEKFTVSCAFVLWVLVLGPYLLPSWLIASGNSYPFQSNYPLYYWLTVYIFGVTLTLGSDAQKNFTLKLMKEHDLNPLRKVNQSNQSTRVVDRPKGQFLINDGFFKYSRNPNFLGEMMLYLSFAGVCNHWLAYAIVIWAWISIMAARIYQKEMSLREKKGWKEYSQQSWILLPKINGRAMDSIVVYTLLLIVSFKILI